MGEQMVAGMVAMADQDFVDLFAAQGMTPTVAANIKSHLNEDMARCILALYRSAAEPAYFSFYQLALDCQLPRVFFPYFFRSSSVSIPTASSFCLPELVRCQHS